MSFTFNEDYLAYQDSHGLISQIGERRRVTFNYIDINSRFRNKKTKIIVNNKIHLINNPIIFTNGSDIICFKHKNHKFKIDDIITIDGVCNKCIILASYLNNVDPSFEINCNFMKIFYNHQIPLDNNNIINVQISNIQGDNGSYLGNIPIASINTSHQVYLSLTASQVSCDMSLFPANYFDPNPNYFFVLLPFNMQISGYVLNKFNYKIQFDAIAGIPITDINTGCTSCHIIKEITNDSFCVQVNTQANINLNMSGGNNVTIGIVSYDESIQGYPSPNKYIFVLPECLNNIIAVRMMSISIPNICKTVDSNSNKILWQDIDSDSHIYEGIIQEGNYNNQELINQIKKIIESIPRIYINGNYTLEHFINISNTGDKYCFEMFKCAILIQPISVVVNISPGQYILTINHPNHNIIINTSILIMNAINTNSIDASLINGRHDITIIDANTYTITLTGVNLISDISITGGGNNVKICVPDQFRFMLNNYGTIVNKLFGLNNCDVCNNDICECSNIQNPFTYSQCYIKTCKQQCKNIFILIKEFKTFYNSFKINNIFSKLICDHNALNIYHKIHHIYKDPIHKVDKLLIEFVDECGNIVDVCEHSFTIEIVTLNDIPNGSMIFTNTGKNYNMLV